MRTGLGTVAVVLIAAQLLTGCTVIGITAGERMDAARFRTLSSVESANHELKRGNEIRISARSGPWAIYRFVEWSDTTDFLAGYMLVDDFSRTDVFYGTASYDSIRVADILEVEVREPPLYGPSLCALGIALDVAVAWVLSRAFSASKHLR